MDIAAEKSLVVVRRLSNPQEVHKPNARAQDDSRVPTRFQSDEIGVRMPSQAHQFCSFRRFRCTRLPNEIMR